MTQNIEGNRCATVVVIEDDLDIRETLRDTLELEGYTVFTAENGKAGLALLATVPRPCIVLLDLMMPVMNGLQFLDVLQANDVLAAIPVVMVTAYSDLAKVAKGASGLVKKPIDLDALLAFVKRYCTGVDT